VFEQLIVLHWLLIQKLSADAEEKSKLTALQMQAAQWQQQKQWQEYQMSLVQYQQQLQQWTMQQGNTWHLAISQFLCLSLFCFTGSCY